MKMLCWAMVPAMAAILALGPAAAMGDDIPVTNAGFELPVLAKYGSAIPTGWTGTAKAYYPDNACVVPIDGTQVLWCLNSSALYSARTTPLASIAQAGTLYTLSTGVGNYSGTDYGFSGYKLDIMVNGVTMASLSGTESPGPGPNSWFTRSVSYTTTPGDVGKPLAIRLSIGDNLTPTKPTVVYDNVSFTSAPGVVVDPPPGLVNVPVTNAGFELPVVAKYGSALPTGWTGTAKAYYPDAACVVPIDGTQVLYCLNSSALYSSRTTPVASIAQAGLLYTLSTAVGTYSGSGYGFSGYKLEILVDNVTMALTSGRESPGPGPDTWFIRSASYTTGPDDVGKHLSIRLSIGDNLTATKPNVVYDNVSLTSQPGVVVHNPELNIPVANAGFESPVLAKYGAAFADGWTGTAKAFYPDAGNVAPIDGNQLLLCRYDTGNYSASTTPVASIAQAGATYTLRTKVGNTVSSGAYGFSGYKLEILVDNVSVAMSSGLESPGPGPDTWFIRSVSYTTGAADVGKPLGIRLSIGDNVSMAPLTRPNVEYDNVSLVEALPLPAYSTADLAVMLAALDATPVDPNWNPAMDLDGDYEITSTDLSILLQRLQ